MLMIYQNYNSSDAAGHTSGMAKWALLIRSAMRRLLANPLHPGIAADTRRLKPCSI